MLAHAIGLVALLASSMPAFADVVVEAASIRAAGHDRCPGVDALPSPEGGQMHLAVQAPAQADDLERTAEKRAEILANYTRLGACHDLLDDLYQWGVLDLVATGIAFGLINNTTRIGRRAEAGGNHRLGREHADFVIGFCTAIMHVHMANRDRARNPPDLSAQSQVIGPVLGSRIARLPSRDAFDADGCRAHIGKLTDGDTIDAVADAMLRRELDDAVEQGSLGMPGRGPGQGFGRGLCAALLNAVMGARR